MRVFRRDGNDRSHYLQSDQAVISLRLGLSFFAYSKKESTKIANMTRMVTGHAAYELSICFLEIRKWTSGLTDTVFEIVKFDGCLITKSWLTVTIM